MDSRRSGRRGWLLVLLAGALGASLVVPGAAEAGPSPVATRQVVVQDDGGLRTLEVSEQELVDLQGALGGAPVVARGRAVQAELAQSVPKVGAPTLWSSGHRGDGKVIVVVDTGVASTFGGALVGQACFAATQVGNQLVGHCGPDADVTEAFDSTCFTLGVCDAGDPDDVLDAQAGRPCPNPSVPKDCAHGTAVAAVAARHEPTPGVAPDAGVYAIRVFNPAGASADLVDLLLALDHVRQLADAGMEIAAVNLSVATSSTFASHCDSGPGASDEAVAFRLAFDQLKARGIGNAVASGNDGKVGSIGLPACVSSAASVGATDLDDQPADFGNRGPSLELLAPGADEGNGAINPMEIPGSPVTEWAGTSFSAPHLAGAFALLEPQYPKASIDQLVAFLRTTGVPVSDPATGASYRRLHLQPPDEALHAQVLFPTNLPVAGTARSAIGDFNGDGHADVLAHGPGGAPDRISYGQAGWTPSVRSYSVSGSYVPLVGNFRGAAGGADDILWYAAGSASDSLWVGHPTGTLPSASVNILGTYSPVIGDFDGDGFDDVLWYAPGSTSDSLWYGGPAAFTSAPVSVLGSYRTAVGDFDGDGRDDLVFHGPGATADTLWRGTTTRGSWIKRALSLVGNYTLRAGDVNGDDSDDLLLYQPGSGSDTIWRGGPGVGGPGASGGFSSLTVSVTGTYQPVLGDVDGDGRDDIVWYAPGGAADYVWFGHPTGPPTSRKISVTGTYTPLVGNLDADDGDEIVWFTSSTTTAPVWWSATG